MVTVRTIACDVRHWIFANRITTRITNQKTGVAGNSKLTSAPYFSKINQTAVHIELKK